MMEKKNFMVNCDVCDARKVQEGSLKEYESIVINGDILLTNEESRRILGELPVTMNIDTVIESEEEYAVQSCNGSYEIKAGQQPEKKTLLLVNGDLKIAPGAQDVLKKYVCIHVNGNAVYPESIAPYLGEMKLNGRSICYPDDCMVLKDTFEADRYFPLRARENGRYFVQGKTVMVDEKLDAAELKKKNVQFVTPKAVLAESKIEDAITCFSEETELSVVKTGYAYVPESLTLDKGALRKYGSKLYVDGDLILDEDSTGLIEKLEAVQVEGDVELLLAQVPTFEKLESEYENMVIVKGRRVMNKVNTVVDQTLLDASPDGVCLKNCVNVMIDETVAPEEIRDKIQFKNCVNISCTPEQKSVVRLVAENVVSIRSDEDEKEFHIGDAVKSLLDSKVVNADTYIL